MKGILGGLLSALLLMSVSPGSEAGTSRRALVETGSLAGTLVLPTSPGSHKGVIIVAGSGPTDRDGNSTLGVNADYLKLLADALAQADIASVRYDKRGVGLSGELVPPETAIRFHDYVDDARVWTEWLREHSEISCIFLLGHSEGGLIATVVAEDAQPAGLVLLSSPGRPLGKVLGEQLSKLPLSDDLRTNALTTLARIEKGERVAEIDPKLSHIFRPSVQPYLISLIAIDPATELAKLSVPTLIVSGDKDLQVTRSDFDLLVRAHPNPATARVAGMNHVLKEVSGDRAANLAAYRTPDLPLAPGLVRAVTDFVTSTPCPTPVGKG